MSKKPALRVALGAKGVSVWSAEIFGGTEPTRVRDFLSRAFGVEEVKGVELRPAASFGSISYGSVGNPAQVWRKLSRALSPSETSPGLGAGEPLRRVDAGLLYLDAPGTTPIRVTRIGAVLSTWRLRAQGDGTLRVWHPALRNRRDVVFRLEEELAAILGVEDFRVNALTARVSIRFDHAATNAERVALELEKAWPRLLDGLDGPPSRKRLVASAGLLGLAYTGQYLVPVVRPVAVAAVAIYGFPNVVNAGKQLRHGQVGLPALYSTGLAFMLFTGLPFTASVMAGFMQLWPHLARGKLVRSQRRLFALQRRRPTWARVSKDDGIEIEVNTDELRRGDRITVRRGETISVDGIVEEGSAAVVDQAPFGGNQAEDRAAGDAVFAGTFVRDGSLIIRVERVGAETSASTIDSLLPHGNFVGLPSSLEAERIANRNVKPILALSALNLVLTRVLQPSQAVVRPDYATAPRLSAQLSALQGVAHGWEKGALFRNPGALDRLAQADAYVIDDSAGLERRSLEVAKVESVQGFDEELLVGYVLAAHRASRNEQSRALAAFAGTGIGARVKAESLARHAGVTRYRDALGGAIEVATPGYLAAAKIKVPQRFRSALAAPTRAAKRDQGAPQASDRSQLRPLAVLRDQEVIGVVSFARTGEVIGKQFVAALAAQNPRARIVYLSRDPQAEALAGELGIASAHAGLRQTEKLALIRNLGRSTLWIGDGSDPEAREPIAASSVSVSIAPLSRVQDDAADVLLPHRGLSALPELLEISRAHAQRLERDYRMVYAANVAGAVGAFLASFTPLQTGLLSNVGTGLIYARHAWVLERLASAAEDRAALLKHSASP